MTPTVRSTFGHLAGLLALAALVHGWVIAHTAVPARDGIGFIRLAWHLHSPPVENGTPLTRWEVLRRAEQAPGYPTILLATATLLGGARPDPEFMMFAAQLASAIAGGLLVVPIYFLGRRWFDARAGIVAAALTQLLPAFAFITSDSLSDAWYLLLLACGLLAATFAFELRTSDRFASDRFALVGLLAGLTYLVRPEGALLVLAAGGVLLLVQRGMWVHGPALLVGLACVLVPWIGGVTGKFSNKPTAKAVMGNAAVRGPLFAAWMSDELREGPLSPRVQWAGKALLSETVQTFHYLGLPLALLGLWLTRHRWQALPATWTPLVLVTMQSLLLFKMATAVGYVSERHTLPLILVGTLWVGALATTWRWAALTLVLGFALLALPVVSKPMHANRVGHHAAGTWLATHATDADDIYDPFCWSHYYAGRVFTDQELRPDARIAYVVVERSTNQHSRLPMLPLARAAVKHAECVFTDHGVEIYRVVREPK